MTPRHKHRALVRRVERHTARREARERAARWRRLEEQFIRSAATPGMLILPPPSVSRPVGETTPRGGIRYPETAPWTPCSRGVCAAEDGHAGTCDEASGWDDAFPVPPEPASVRRERADTLIRRYLTARKPRTVTGHDDALPRITWARRVRAAFGLDGSHPDGVHVPLDTLTGPGTHDNATTAQGEAWQAVVNEAGRLADAHLPPLIGEEDPLWWVPISAAVGAGSLTETWCVRAPTAADAERIAMDDAREAIPNSVLTIGTPVRAARDAEPRTTRDRGYARFVTYGGDSKVAAAFHPPQRIRGEDVHHDYDRVAAHD